jgi:hypothetical protein
MIRPAADLGDAFAQAWMARQTDGKDRFRWAQKSAAQGERDGFYFFGHCYRVGSGCEKSVERAKENFFVAVEHGNVVALVFFGRLFDIDNPQIFLARQSCCCKRGIWSLLERNARSDSQLQFWNWTYKSRFRNRTSSQRTHRQREANNLWESWQV